MIKSKLCCAISIACLMLAKGGFADCDLSIGIAVAPEESVINHELEYTISIGNSGPDTASDVFASIVLPDNVNLLSCVSDQGECEAADDVVSVSAGTVASNQTISVGIRVRAMSGGTAYCHAAVYGDCTDPVSENNRASLSAVIHDELPGPVLSIPSPHGLTVGQATNIAITVHDPERDSVTVVNTVAPEGSTFSNNVFSWTPKPEHVGGRHYAVFVADDHRGSAFSVVTGMLEMVVSARNEIFVSASGSGVYPYSSWETAATSIETALSVAGYGSAISIGTGSYSLSSELRITNGIIIRGAEGNEATEVLAAPGSRCMDILHADAVVQGITVAGGSSAEGSGIRMVGGLARECTISGNILQNAGAASGGGVHMTGGTLRNCVITDNTAASTSLAASGVGVFMAGGLIENCTIAWNHLADDPASSSAVAGYGEIRNSVVYDNTHADQPMVKASGGTLSCIFSCIEGGYAGEGNISDAPRFRDIGDVRFEGASPCINAGTNCAWMTDALDWRGRTRIEGSSVDMGAVEFYSGDVEPGTVSAYVSISGSHTYPFSSLATAATNIQDAVDVAEPWTTVMVDSGVYTLSSTIVLTNSVTLKTINGAESTVIDGNDLVGCVSMAGAGSILDGFTVQRGRAEAGAAVHSSCGGVIRNCIVSSNAASAQYPYGVVFLSESELLNSTVMRNVAGGMCMYGGGVYAVSSRVQNCVIAWNRVGTGMSGYGAGIQAVTSIVENCTIACNSNGSASMTGALHANDSRVENTIAYFNVGGDCWTWGGEVVSTHTDSDPMFYDRFAGDFRLVPGLSPCIDGGTNRPWMSEATDAAGNPRISGSRVDMGALEYQQGAIFCSFYCGETAGTTPFSVVFNAVLGGEDQASVVYSWDFDNDGEADLVGPGLACVTNVYETAGKFSVQLSVSNAAGESASFHRTDLIEAGLPEVFVSLSGSHTPPFTNWATAATNLSDAVSAVRNGARVWVGAGEYHLAHEVVVDYGVTIESVDGWSNTILNGNDSNRCFMVNHAGAAIRGFTLTRGRGTTRGGAIYNNGGTIENCLIVSNHSGAVNADAGMGGGVYNLGGVVRNCVLLGNTATPSPVFSTSFGGAVYLSGGGTVESCTIVGNKTYPGTQGVGGGAVGGSGTVINSILLENSGGDVKGVDLQFCLAGGWWSGEGNRIGNPLFVDKAAGNFALSMSSPAIDAGTNATWMLDGVDIAGSSRIAGGVVDMGAFEASLDVSAIEIAAPNYGNSFTCHVEHVALAGLVAGPSPIVAMWSNTLTGASGPATVTDTGTVFQSWQATVSLEAGEQVVVVSASFSDQTVRTDSILITYDESGTPANMESYVPGPVTLVDAKVDLQSSPATVARSRPCFSWTFDDANDDACQIGYQIQVCRSQQELVAGEWLLWNSGAVSSEDAGDGIDTIIQGTACTSNGPWYWRARVFSSSGFRSEWSDIMSYQIPTSDVAVSISRPAGSWGSTTGAAYPLSGWVSWNATNLVWTNEHLEAGGQIPFIPGKDWTNSIPLAFFTNSVKVTAQGAEGESSREVVLVRLPEIVITDPNDGQLSRCYTNIVCLQGVVECPDDLLSLTWTNPASGASGSIAVNDSGSATAAWRAVLKDVLVPESQTISVSARYRNMEPHLESTDSVELLLDPALQVPDNYANMCMGAVCVRDMRVNGQSGHVYIDKMQPDFSWKFADAINHLDTPMFEVYSCGHTRNDLSMDGCVGDVTGDGLPDLVIANYYEDNYVMINNGGDPNEWTRVSLTNAPGNVSHVVSVADVTGDGRAEILFGEYARPSFVLLNVGGTPDTWPRFSIGNSRFDVWAMAVGDLTQDGRPDVVLGTENHLGRQNYVALNNGGNPSTWQCWSLGSWLMDCTRDVRIGDVDGDGLSDVVVGNIANGGSAFNYVLLNNGGMPNTWPRFRLGAEELNGGGRVALGDITGDGRVDVASIVSENGTNRNVVWVNNGGAPDTWNRIDLALETFPTANAMSTYELVDMNGDALPDFVAGGDAGGIHILINNGGSVESWSNVVAVAESRRAHSICDYNLDGRPDFALSTIIRNYSAAPEVQRQAGYCVEVYRTEVDEDTGLSTNVLVWNSGIVKSSNSGDGISSIRQAVPCTEAGDYSWRVQVYSSSGYRSGWSEFSTFALNPACVYMQVESPSIHQVNFTDAAFASASGWVSPQAIGLIWSNISSGAAGSIEPEADTTWSCDVPLVDGTNILSVIAQGAEQAVTQNLTVVFSRPNLKITHPVEAPGEYVTPNPAAVLGGWVEWTNTPSRLWWSNVTARTMGSTVIDRAPTSSIFRWTTEAIPLVVSTQRVKVWMEYSDGSLSKSDEIDVRLEAGSEPSFDEYPTGVVNIVNRRVNGQLLPVTTSVRNPLFSWAMGEALNVGSPAALMRSDLGQPVEDMTYAMVVGDLTGDGRQDVILANAEGQNDILVNNGGTAETWPRHSLGSAMSDETSSLAIADINADGLPDMVVGNYGQNYVLFNNGGSPESWSRVNLGPEWDDQTLSVAVGDINGDGRPDVAVANWQQPSVVLINNGDSPATWTRSWNVQDEWNTRVVLIVDIDGDGLNDILTAAEAQSNLAYINNGGAPEGWMSHRIGACAADWTYSMAVADLNDDGRPDIIVGNYGQNPTPNWIILNDGREPHLWESIPFGAEGAIENWTRSVAAVDINGDGRIDVLAGDSVMAAGEQNYVMLNNGRHPSTWQRENLGDVVEDMTKCLAVGDLNGDGRPDVVIGNSVYNAGRQNTVLLSYAEVMQFVQKAYRIQVSTSPDDWDALVWDSGIVESPCSGDGVSAVRQETAWPGPGTYYWRVKVFSTSRLQSEWSEAMPYIVPSEEVFLSITEPVPPIAAAAAAAVNISGWVSANATGIVWSNSAMQWGGTIGATGGWTQTVDLAMGTNVLVFTAQSAAGQAVTQTLVLVRHAEAPSLAITQPTSAATMTTDQVTINLAGSLTPPLDMVGREVFWRNEATGESGMAMRSESNWPSSGYLEVPLKSEATNVIHVWCNSPIMGVTPADTISVFSHDAVAPDMTVVSPNGGVDFQRVVDQVSLLQGSEKVVISGTASDNSNIAVLHCSRGQETFSVSLKRGDVDWSWQSAPIVLMPGTNTFHLRADDAAGNSSATVSFSIECAGVATPGDATSPGSVFVDDLGVNRQGANAIIGDIEPKFSWRFGDALNAASVVTATSVVPGEAYYDTSRYAVIADVTGNGRLDIVVANSGYACVIENDGGSPTGWVRRALGMSDRTAIAVGDVTGDGLPDMVFGRRGHVLFPGCLAGILVNNGGPVETWSGLPMGPSLTDGASALAIADVTGDGRPDLVVGTETMNGDGAQNFVLVNNGALPNEWPRVLLGSAMEDSTRSIVVTDMDGDGHPDVVVGNGPVPKAALAQSYVLLNNGSCPSTWTRHALGDPSSAESLAVGDLTGDGRPDVVFGNYAQDGRQNHVLINNGGLPESWYRYNLGSYLPDNTRSVALADMNGDGLLDVLVGNDDGQHNYCLLNNGDQPGTWSRSILGDGAAGFAQCLAVGDLNMDGRTDVFVANAGPKIIGPPPGGQNLVLLNTAESMPFTQWKYQVQVARSVEDFASGQLFWDSGVVASPSSGEGLFSIRQGVPCDSPGDYFWRVRAISSSRYESPWSSIARYAIPSNVVFLSVYDMEPVTYMSAGSSQGISGWASWNVTDLAVRNELVEQGGAQPIGTTRFVTRNQKTDEEAPPSGFWTQEVALAYGINHIVVSACDDGGQSVTQRFVIAYRVPRIAITQPSETGVAVYQNAIAIGGSVESDDPIESIVWSNSVSGMSGFGELERMSSGCDGFWRASVTCLVSRTQNIKVFAVSDVGVWSLPAELMLDYDDRSGAEPYDLNSFPTGLVIASDLQVNRQAEGAIVSDALPRFQWQFGDGLNSGSPADLSREFLGSALSDWTRAIDAGDLTGDGLPDVVVGNDFERNYVLVNNGGELSTWSRTDLGVSTNDMTMAVVIADLTGDGHPDVVIGNEGERNSVVINNGVAPSTWTRVALGSALTNDRTRAIAVADVTGDGRLDVVVGNRRGPSAVVVGGGDDPSGWQRVEINEGRCDDVRAVAVADVTGDGRPDIVLGALDDASAVLVNNGGSPDTWSRLPLPLPAETHVHALAIGDIDLDGLADIVLGNSHADSLLGGMQNLVLLNNGESPATWSCTQLGTPHADRTYSLALTDINGDGRPDVLVGNGFNEQNVAVMNNGGDPSTWSRVTLGAQFGDSTHAIAATDLNGDSRPDIVVGNLASPNAGFINGVEVMQKQQAAYRIQLAYETDKFVDSTLEWDSGWVESSCVGDGVTSVAGCVLDKPGLYYWRVKLLSSGGCQGGWSAPSRFTYEGLPAIRLSVPQEEFDYEEDCLVLTGGNNSYFTGAIVWSNSLTGQSGTIDPSDMWTDTIPLGVGTNIIVITGSNRVGVTACKTIEVVRIPEDLDGNGIPNWWELMYFGDRTAADGDADVDCDGASNQHEYLSGTDPLNPNSTFAMDEPVSDGNIFRIPVRTQPGYTYTVYFVDGDLRGEWRTFADGLRGVWIEGGEEPSEHVFEDRFDSETSGGAPDGGVRFYKVKSQKP